MMQEYERRGLIRCDARNHYGHLLYDEKTVDRILLIRILNMLGMTLSEIGEFMDMEATERTETLSSIIDRYSIELKDREALIDKARSIVSCMNDDDFITEAASVLRIYMQRK